ncbi:MAG: histidine phosphatase family protein [Clostridiales Family XIII bacterium]|jgi:broad specificity phosphatase PhoE|nr:histidine phosphatase family protein [Clostridiales Family XIII bacterium]
MSKRRQKQQSSFLGYILIVFAPIISVYQLASTSGPVALIVILILSVVIAALLKRFYPKIERYLYVRKADKEKYFPILESEEVAYSRVLILQTLAYVDDETRLLDPIIQAIDTKKYKDAIKIGLFSSSIFLRLGKHYIRVLNGIYVLKAISLYQHTEEAASQQEAKSYAEYYIKVNDLGWSQYKLEPNERTRLRQYVHEKGLGAFEDSLCKEQSEVSPMLVKTRDRLQDERKFHYLICQADRHILSFDLLDQRSVMQALETEINKISNKDDRKRMMANLLFLKAEIVLKKNDHDQFKTALSLIDDAEREYELIRDEDRQVKCYNLRGRIHFAEGAREKAKQQFKLGHDESRRIARYDEFYKNIKSLIEFHLSNNEEEEARKYAAEGVSVASAHRDSAEYNRFITYLKPKHILLIRHGESEKNVRKIISGEGSLTQIGRSDIEELSARIKSYIDDRGFKQEDVFIYGFGKKQVSETVTILQKLLPQAHSENNENLLPVTLGEKLQGKSESDLIQSEEYHHLDLWRDKRISIQELYERNKESGMEAPEKFWERAESFFNNLSNSGFVIIVCTTSVSILLTHYLMNNRYDSDRYKAIDVPLGGMVHFIKDEKSDTYSLLNRDTNTNIAFFELER